MGLPYGIAFHYAIYIYRIVKFKLEFDGAILHCEI